MNEETRKRGTTEKEQGEEQGENGNEEGGKTDYRTALRFRCERCAAAVMKHSKYSVFSLYRKETKYATVRNEKLSEFSALLALFAVNIF
ncbi:MAG: hypothetical protein K2P88_12250 [Chitinophagaceae bacterium]|nr:hypothetical protein [Chitinophagaceae bacterium]